MKKLFKMKKAFTLVELLAVVAIIAILILLIIPAVIGVLNDTKQTAYDNQVENIVTAAKFYVSDNKSSITELQTPDTMYTMTLQQLGTAGYIELPIKNPLTGENIDAATFEIGVTKSVTGKLTYETDEDGFDIVTPTTLTLIGSNPATVACAATGNYADPGAAVTDPLDEDAANVYATPSPLAKKNAGSYTLTYSYTSSLPVTVTKTRTVDITNTNLPTITVTGGTGLRELTQGGAFTAPTATATDVCDGAITVNVSSNVVPTVQGMYTVTYTATNLGGTTKTTIIDVEVLSPTNLDTSGANVPNVTSNMIPVYWDTTALVWKKADSNNKSTRCLWYDYSSGAKRWANVVTVTAASRAAYQSAIRGTTINETDILTYFVWVPRYKYMIPAGSGDRTITVAWEAGTPAKSTGNAITTYRTHPAYTFNAVELTGFWFGKFETTGTPASFTIKPNLVSQQSYNVSSLFTGTRDMETAGNGYGFVAADVDTHMLKNSEWGAVTYLSRSIYGLNSEVYKNNSSSEYTGRSGGNVSGSQVLVGSVEYINSGFYTYDGKCATTTTLAPGISASCTAVGNELSDKTLAYKASVTGNIYGIYDMSGGAREYVMGNYNNYSGNDDLPMPNHSGFTGPTINGGAITGVTWPATKYYNLYTTGVMSTACSGGICYGEAMSEIASYNATDESWYGWYGDWMTFQTIVDGGTYIEAYPWIARGSTYGPGNGGTEAGIFGMNCEGGSPYTMTSTRIAVAVGAGL